MAETRYPANIVPLTSLRFCAATAIFLYHLTLFFPLAKSWITAVFARSYLGVDFFFMLSGFILMHVYLPPYRQGIFSPRNFLVHRLARIYPMHLLTLFLAALLSLVHAKGWAPTATIPTLVANIFLVQSWGNAASFSFNQPSWSISAEWFAYLAFPLILPVLARTNFWEGIVCVLCFFIGTLAIMPLIFHMTLTGFSAAFSMLRVLPEFCLGMGLYLFSQRYPFRCIPRLSLPIFAIMTTAAIAIGTEDQYCLILLAAILYAAAGISLEKKQGVLSSPILIYLGDISYSFYMIHFLVQYAAWRLFYHSQEIVLWLIATYLATIVLSALMHRYVELPARKVLRRAGGA